MDLGLTDNPYLPSGVGGFQQGAIPCTKRF
jgi:hypothetical protein